jgi:O-antigen/teichoic acid export membrane protein
MNFKSTIRATTSAYFGTLTAAATGLISIRLATQFLSKEEFGLWSFTMQTVGYFMLLDLGVANSVTRLLGEPLASGDTQRIHSWFTLSSVILLCQALVIFISGLIMRPYVLDWFNIPSHLLERASSLWLAFLLIQAVGLVFKLSFAILYAQNRVYWTSHLQSTGAWLGLCAFFLMLHNGWGVFAYAWSSGIAMLFTSLGGIYAVRRSKLHLRLSLKGVTRAEISRLFRLSSSVFVIGLASQIYFASQGLVTTRILGLEAAAILAVTNRAAFIAMGAIWKPFDAFSPRWQIAYCDGELERVRREFGSMTRFTILLGAAAASAVALINQPFVLWWTKPDYFGGLSVSLMLAAFIIIQGINRCFIAPFVLTMKMRAYTLVNIFSVILAIILMISLTKVLGLVGIPLGLILADLTLVFWFYIIKGAGCIGVDGFQILFKDIWIWAPLVAFSFGLALILKNTGFQSNFTWFLVAITCATAICLPMAWRAGSIIRQLRAS